MPPRCQRIVTKGMASLGPLWVKKAWAAHLPNLELDTKGMFAWAADESLSSRPGLPSSHPHFCVVGILARTRRARVHVSSILQHERELKDWLSS
jgi:hypothetical protein